MEGQRNPGTISSSMTENVFWLFCGLGEKLGNGDVPSDSGLLSRNQKVHFQGHMIHANLILNRRV